MYLDDPFQVPQAFVPKEEKPDFRQEFYREGPDMRPTQGRETMATMYVCRYVDGRHEMPPRPWCGHYETHDETGARIRESWSVQDGN